MFLLAIDSFTSDEFRNNAVENDFFYFSEVVLVDVISKFGISALKLVKLGMYLVFPSQSQSQWEHLASPKC